MARRHQHQHQRQRRRQRRTLLAHNNVALFMMLFWSSALLVLHDTTNAFIATNGSCPLVVFLPFTIKGERQAFLDNAIGTKTPVGYASLATVLLAIDHFNRRNPIVVPELAFMGECDVTFDESTIQIFDTRSGGPHAGRDVTKWIARRFMTKALSSSSSSSSSFASDSAGNIFDDDDGNDDGGNSSGKFGYDDEDDTYDSILPCGMVGPSHEIPATDVAGVANAARIPHVAYGGFNAQMTLDHYNQFTSRTSDDVFTNVDATVSYLRHHGRHDFYAVLYPVSEIGIQFNEALKTILLQKLGGVGGGMGGGGAMGDEPVRFSDHGYDPAIYEEVDWTSKTTRLAVASAKRSGFRTVVCILEDPDLDIQYIADAAEEHDMNNGDYFWIFLGDIATASWLMSTNTNVTKLLTGSAYIRRIEPFLWENETVNAFARAWSSQNALHVERVNEEMPLEPNDPGYYQAPHDFFQSHPPLMGTGFLYDAIMAMGMGACTARRNSSSHQPPPSSTSPSLSNDTTSSLDHIRGIHRTTFTGVTGPVSFGDFEHFGSSGGRHQSGLTFAAINIHPNGTGSFSLADIKRGNDTKWTPMARHFVFADGRTSPPDHLRDPPEQNHIRSQLKAFGFVLLGLSYVLCFATAVWIFVYRHHRVLKASQPVFLFLLVLGTFMTVTAIVPLSFDEGWGFDDSMLDRACISTIWLYFLGQILTYMALFVKLWRLDQVLQFRKRQVDIKHVLWPGFIVMVLSVTFLALWTAFEDHGWVRTEVDDVTGESVGMCTGGKTPGYMMAGAVVYFLPILLTLYVAWKTKDVDTAYSDSSWIFTAVAVQMEVVFIAIPILLVLENSSTNAKYLGEVLLTFCVSMSILILIMIPKVGAWYRARGGLAHSADRQQRGGPTGSITVSGLQFKTPLPSPPKTSTLVSEASSTRISA